MEVKKGYKKTEIGVIPADWELEDLDRCVAADSPICYGILMPGNDVLGGVPVIKVKNFVGGTIKEDELLHTSKEIDTEYQRSRLLPGDILLSIRGSVGEVCIVPNSLAGANITQDTASPEISHGV